MEEGHSETLQVALRALHAAVAEVLLERISSGTASSSEHAAAIKFLKNNGITKEYQTHASTAMRDLEEAINLPFQPPLSRGNENDQKN